MRPPHAIADIAHLPCRVKSAHVIPRRTAGVNRSEGDLLAYASGSPIWRRLPRRPPLAYFLVAKEAAFARGVCGQPQGEARSPQRAAELGSRNPCVARHEKA